MSEERSYEDIGADRVHEAAADWFARLQDREVTLEETLEWQRWMSADQRHAVAFSRLEEAWDVLQSASSARIESLALEKHPARRWTALHSIAASVIAVSIALSFGVPTADEPVQRIRTPVGENLTFKLDDGSQVTLGGNSEIEIAYSADERAIQLTRGEAYFTVAGDPSRPFRVSAGKAAVVAIGTQFNVRRSDDRVVVAVVEGRVRVEPTPSAVMVPLSWLRERAPGLRRVTPQLEPLQLDAGRQAVANENGVGSPVILPDPATVGGWRAGMLSFQSEPLRYVVEHVNRYASKSIVIADDALGELRITGTVVEGDVTDWVGSLESALSLVAQEENGRIVLRQARKE